MKQPQLIPKRRKRKHQPTASMYREQLRLAADRIIELERVIDTTKRLMGWDRPEPPPPPPPKRIIREDAPGWRSILNTFFPKRRA